MTANLLMARECTSLSETLALAAALARLLHRGDCLLLKGDLGAGKTEFARALIRALGDASVEVASPTFTLMQSYPVTLEGGETATCWHADLYRIESPAELPELGLEEALEEGLLLVEWPEIAGAVLPPSSLEIRIASASDRKRHIEMYGDASWQLRLAGLSATTAA